MADPTFKLCDICGAMAAGGRLHLTVAREMDAAGSMDTRQEILDLCDKHKTHAILFLVSVPGSERITDFETAERLLKWAKEQKKGK